jgi:glutathione S-transferase
MKLHYYPHAPYSRKVLLGAYEKGVQFERILCAPFDGAAKAALKSVHPLATIPLLEDGAEIVTESSLILEYFDLVSPGSVRLIPEDPREALRVRALDRFGDAHLMGPTVYLAWALRKPVEQQNAEKIAAQRRTVETALGLLEARLADGRRFLAGTALTMGDCSSVAALSCLLSDGSLPSLDPWPRVGAWYRHLTTRPSFAAILDECQSVPLPPGFD